MKILSIIGARPQFIKAAPVSHAIRAREQAGASLQEVIVHTGQHYDENMSAIFFQELNIPEPHYHLGVGSGSHGVQTGQMLEGIEKVLVAEKPGLVLVYGDTNSTLAGALAASKLHLPIAHVEAGLRSFNRRMPEEINRVVADHLSDLLFCPSQTAVKILAQEGILHGVHLVGDIMADSLDLALNRIDPRSDILSRFGMQDHSYLLATIHRAENTDQPENLKAILTAFQLLNESILFPVHPRTRKTFEKMGYSCPANVRLMDPVGYLDMVRLEKAARMILTDSGGIQKEAYWLSVPCITLRNETEWVETVQNGWNILTGAETRRIVEAVQSFSVPFTHPPLYGDGRAAIRCVDLLEKGFPTEG
ncbi:MAG: UDP-N-acetylglucosamine 2-epimerase [Deltaproteobacteria bacterium]|jgi:UDP-N-acetylglucosamine 2-epimerase|nr:UDP-N-acetylglucosamine 2-epimerase [Deltaproteobacteria bacterium]